MKTQSPTKRVASVKSDTHAKQPKSSHANGATFRGWKPKFAGDKAFEEAADRVIKRHGEALRKLAE